MAISLWGRHVTGLPVDFQMQGAEAFHGYDDETRNPLGGRSKSKYRGVTELALGLPSRRGKCPTCHGEGVVERSATPDEVDNGCELGIAYDPCPTCGGAGMTIERTDDGAD